MSDSSFFIYKGSSDATKKKKKKNTDYFLSLVIALFDFDFGSFFVSSISCYWKTVIPVRLVFASGCEFLSSNKYPLRLFPRTLTLSPNQFVMTNIWRLITMFLFLGFLWKLGSLWSSGNERHDLQPFKAFVACTDTYNAHLCLRRYANVLLDLKREEMSRLAFQVAQMCFVQVQDQALLESAIVLGVQNCFNIAQFVDFKLNVNTEEKASSFPLLWKSFFFIAFAGVYWTGVFKEHDSEHTAQLDESAETIINHLNTQSDQLPSERPLNGYALWMSQRCKGTDTDHAPNPHKPQVNESFMDNFKAEELFEDDLPSLSGESTKVSTPASSAKAPIHHDPEDTSKQETAISEKKVSSAEKSELIEPIEPTEFDSVGIEVRPGTYSDSGNCRSTEKEPKKKSFNISTPEGRAAMRAHIQQVMSKPAQ